jgi:hypothetical protein
MFLFVSLNLRISISPNHSKKLEREEILRRVTNLAQSSSTSNNSFCFHPSDVTELATASQALGLYLSRDNSEDSWNRRGLMEPIGVCLKETRGQYIHQRDEKNGDDQS